MTTFHLGMFGTALQTRTYPGSWLDEAYPLDPGFDGPELWVNAAKLCEEAKFDLVFLSDTEGVLSEYEGRRDGALRHGISIPRYDQTVVADYMAAGTRHVGLVSTVATTAVNPYLLARRFATMDHFSRGRTGWNIVTSTHRGGVQGVGLGEQLPHDERYDRADELVALCKQLWNSWEPDALVMDRKREVYVDPARVHDVHFEGRWYRSYAPLNVHRSPQGGPLLAQAGASPRGIAFAAKHAELIFAVKPNPEAMRNYYRTVREAVGNAGRDPNGTKILFGMQAFIGESEAEAREKFERHRTYITPERAMVWMSGLIGYDLSTLDPETPVEKLQFPGADSIAKSWLEGGLKTVYEVSLAEASSTGLTAVGTPEQIADWLCDTIAFVGGDGFMFKPGYLPYDLVDFTTKVVPLLQRRGVVRREYAGTTLREHLLAF